MYVCKLHDKATCGLNLLIICIEFYILKLQIILSSCYKRQLSNVKWEEVISLTKKIQATLFSL